MAQSSAGPTFAVIGGAEAAAVLTGREPWTVDIIRDAYRAHGEQQTVNPPSYFLRFPDRPSARIIALPAAVGGSTRTDGVKWISSFPGNVGAGLPRASGVLILNDPGTGFPFACLECSIISAARTAASATLAADVLSRPRKRPSHVGFVGAGLIARYVYTYLVGTGWEFEEVGVQDLSQPYARAFTGHIETNTPGARTVVYDEARKLVENCDLVVFATVAAEPYIEDASWLGHCPLVLHLSLRDLAPSVVESTFNVVDDVDHCLRAQTSLHLLEQQCGHRDFIHGTLYDALVGTMRAPADRPVVFSPFGLGTLDIALGRAVYDEISGRGALNVVPEFFSGTSRTRSTG
jgi:ornithine cyclodeaminase